MRRVGGSVGGRNALPICILQVLRDYSDEEHPLTSGAIIQKLQDDYGMTASRNAVGRNISLLCELGWDISTYEENGRGAYLRNREFSNVELRVLIDSVLSSRYIPQEDARSLIEKLADQANRYFRGRLRHVHSLPLWPHHRNRAFFENLECIEEAIKDRRQLRFILNSIDVKGVLIPKGKRFYVVHPFAMICTNGQYYLVGCYDGCSNLTHYRIDRMTEVEVLDEEEQSHVNASCEFIANVASNIIEFRRDTLTILEMKRSDERLYQRLMEELPNVMFVRLEEEITFKREAKTYLRRLAMKNGIKNCSSLLGCLAPSDSGYLSSDLNKLFDKWYDEYLRTELHVQYRELTSGQKKIQSKPKGDAYRDLMEMVGLQPVKEVILQAVEFHKAQKLFSGRGITAARPAMHMVFAGNPGTAKTTVARLMARIMKDNGLLSVGGLVEVGRGDLVGKYVGWTAQIVKKKFKEARGSVLFIDEAYSLVEDRGGLYGDEAINTIVQEMENARDDTVVVFAGYPDRMKEFVKRNPGLRSRVAFHIDFLDYTVDELLEIFTLILKNRGHHAAPTALERARCLMEEALGTPDFGNGRFVRNMAEQAEMRQAARLLHLPPDTVTDEDIRTFIPEDLGMPEHPEGARRRGIGFA